MIEKVFECPETFVIGNDSIKRCNIHSENKFVEKISGPKRSIKIIDHFTYTSTNVIYCFTCTYCNKL